MADNLYNSIRRNKTVIAGMIGTILGFGGMVHSLSYKTTEVPPRLQSIQRLEQELRVDNPFINATFNDLTSQVWQDSILNQARERRAELDRTYENARQEITDYESRKDANEKKGYCILFASGLLALLSVYKIKTKDDPRW